MTEPPHTTQDLDWPFSAESISWWIRCSESAASVALGRGMRCAWEDEANFLCFRRCTGLAEDFVWRLDCLVRAFFFAGDMSRLYRVDREVELYRVSNYKSTLLRSWPWLTRLWIDWTMNLTLEKCFCFDAIHEALHCFPLSSSAPMPPRGNRESIS